MYDVITKTSIRSQFYSKREVKTSLKGVERKLQVKVPIKKRNKSFSRRSWRKSQVINSNQKEN